MPLEKAMAATARTAVNGHQDTACLAACGSLNASNPSEKQRSSIAVDPSSSEAMAETEEFLLDEIFHDLNLITSYATSALEAARRGDREELQLRLRVHLRDCFRHAVELHNLLPSVRKVGASEAGRSAA